MPKLRYIIPVFIVMALSIIATPISAFDPPPEGSECDEFDFTSDDYDFIPGGYSYFGPDPIGRSMGVYAGGVGWQQTQYDFVGGGGTHSYDVAVSISTTFEEALVTRVSIVFNKVNGNTPYPNAIFFTNGVLAAQNTVSGTAQTLTWEGSQISDKVGFQVWANGTPGGSYTGSALITSAEICYDAIDYTKPLSLNNVADWGMYQHPDETTVIAVSQSPGDYVYAIGDGIVTDITPFTNDDQCEELVGQSELEDLTGFCFFTVPQSVSDSNGDYSYVLDDNITRREDWYRVTITSSDDSNETHEYFIANAEEFITLGMLIDAGCILGRTLPFKGWEFALSPEIIGGTRNQRGVAWVERRVSDVSSQLLDYLVVNPEMGNACNVDPEHRTCLGDSALQYPQDWTTQGGAAIESPGATLPGYSSIYQQFNLNPDRTPTMLVGARAFGGSAQMILQIGTTQQSFSVVGSSFQEYSIAAGAHAADNGIFYTIQVTNDSPATIELDFVCIKNTTEDDGSTPVDDPPPQPPVCFFDNYSFTTNSDWSTSGTVYYETGQLVLAADGVISQSVDLYEADGGGAQEYTVTAEVGLDYSIAYTENPAASGINFDFEYQVPGASWASMSPTPTDGDFILADNKIQVSDSFNIAADTSGSFGFRYTPDTSLGAALGGVAYRKVCICTGSECDTDNPGPEDFPGYDDDGIPDLPFEPTCDVIERPSGNGIGTWITYLWANLNSFFQCDLMVLLNQMYTVMMDTFRLIGWNVRYWQSTMHAFVDWLEFDLLPWLAGYLSNAGGNTYVYDSGSENCEWYNIFCHITNALDVLGPWFAKLVDLIVFALDRFFGPVLDFVLEILSRTFDFFFSVLDAILSLVFLILSKLIETITFTHDWFQALISAWNNSTPEPLPGIPDCSMNENQLVSVCLAVWAMENTFFSGDVGSVIIPVFTSLMGILMILYFVRKWKTVAEGLVGALE